MTSNFLLFVSLVVFCLVHSSIAVPNGFMYGMATASYQIEGAWNVSGRGPSIWDTFSHTPGKVWHNDNGDVADDFYHKFEQDIQLMVKYKITHFRMSLSWTRILPAGSGTVNQAGIDFYNSVINTLLANNIQPVVTLFHWDMPQALEDSYLSWLGPQIVDDFNNYADVCFKAFGDRVKYWFTFNEPLSFCNLGYASGGNAPGRCSDRNRCSAGNSTTEPWIVGHRVLLSHSKAVKTYRLKYQNAQQGRIGIVLNSDWSAPYTNTSADRAAAQRSMDFMLGWFADPIWFGDYPQSMKDLLGPLLPSFTPQEKFELQGSYDFFGLNHYTSRYIGNAQPPYENPQRIVSYDRNPQGVPIGPVADSEWLIVVPWGFHDLLRYIFDRYKTPIIVAENGCDAPGESAMPISKALDDTFRVDYFKDYLREMKRAMSEGAQVIGYFAWSFMDNFEWADGYQKRFGVTYVDYASPDLNRYPKKSAAYLADFFTNWN